MAEEQKSGKTLWASVRKPALRITLFLMIIAFLLSTQSCHNMMFLFPKKEIAKTPAAHNVKFENVSFTSENGNKLTGWFCPAENPTGAVVINHGNAGNIGLYVDYAQYFTQAGISVLLYDYQGFGNSEGKADLQQLIPDGLAAFDYLQNRLGDQKIAIMGVSMGTPVSCAVAARRQNASALILEGSFIPKTEVYWRFGIVGRPIAWLIYNTLPPIYPVRDIKQLSGRPLLMVHGSEDNVTPLLGAAQLYEAAPLPKWMYVMDGAAHFPTTIATGREAYGKMLAEFLKASFGGNYYDQPRVNWQAQHDTAGKWQVDVYLQVERGPAHLVVLTEDNTSTTNPKVYTKGFYHVQMETESRPLTVTAFDVFGLRKKIDQPVTQQPQPAQAK